MCTYTHTLGSETKKGICRNKHTDKSKSEKCSCGFPGEVFISNENQCDWRFCKLIHQLFDVLICQFPSKNNTPRRICLKYSWVQDQKMAQEYPPLGGRYDLYRAVLFCVKALYVNANVWTVRTVCSLSGCLFGWTYGGGSIALLINPLCIDCNK